MPSTTGQCARAVALRALHCRVVPYRRSPQSAASHVRRRLSSLPQDASQGCGHRSRPSLHLCYPHQRLDDDKPTAIKPNQDPGYVAGFKPAAGQDRHKEVPLLSTRVTVVDTARDLGVEKNILAVSRQYD